ncbi:MAG: hypothetical protein WAK31_18380 [Chthoniobacterales bacterium]
MRALLRKHEFRPEPVDIKGLIEGVSELLHGTLISRKARLRIDLAPALPLVSGDPVHLQQVLLNLILNALEAMIDCPSSERQVVVRATANTVSPGIVNTPRPVAAAGGDGAGACHGVPGACSSDQPRQCAYPDAAECGSARRVHHRSTLAGRQPQLWERAPGSYDH